LSYTTFAYNDLKLSNNKFEGKVVVTVTVKNSGRVAGKEVIQLYVSAPKQRLKKPVKELRAFAKTRLLKPGESQSVSFTLTAGDLASFDPSTSSWIAEAGSYSVNVGASSMDIKSSAKMELAKEIVVERSKKLLAPAPGLKELDPPM
jgi:beta-glucosidase